MIIASAECDRCGRTESFSHVGKTYIKKWLRSVGWSFGKQDLCPECKAELRKKKKEKK